MNSRRKFIKKAGLGMALTSVLPLDLFSFNKDLVKISILHTNDIHSHIDPFDSGRNKGLGGLVQLSSLINKIKLLVKKQHHELIEDLAENIFEIIFQNRLVKKTNIKIEKLDIIKNSESVGIEFSKSKI